MLVRERHFEGCCGKVQSKLRLREKEATRTALGTPFQELQGRQQIRQVGETKPAPGGGPITESGASKSREQDRESDCNSGR